MRAVVRGSSFATTLCLVPVVWSGRLEDAPEVRFVLPAPAVDDPLADRSLADGSPRATA